MERARQSDTWAIASPEARPWLLMLWATAWEQTPCGSLPNDDDLIAARIGMPAKLFAKHRAVLLRKWWAADDGRLYHAVLVQRVAEMMKTRRSESDRKAAARARDAARIAEDSTRSPGVVPVLSRGTDTGLPPESGTGTGTGTSTSTRTEEKTKAARKRAAPAVLVSVDEMVAEGVARQHAEDWLVNRKTKGLAPLTPTIWQETKGEADKAGLPIGDAIKTAAGEGWGGFKAKWLTASDGRSGAAATHDQFAGAK